MGKKTANARMIIIIAITVVLFAVLAGRFAQFQIVETEAIATQAKQSEEKTISVEAARGEITDRYGRVIAGNSMSYSVIIRRGSFPSGSDGEKRIEVILLLCDLLAENGETLSESLPLNSDPANPQFLSDRDGDIADLKELLDKQPYATAQNCFDALVERYGLEELPASDARKVMGVRYEMEIGAYSSYRQITIAKNISMATITAVREQSELLPGVYIAAVPERTYYMPDIAAHIIGYTGPIYAEEYAELKAQGYALDDEVGKSGIEKMMESYLRGTDGTTVTNSDDPETTVTKATDPIPGATVVLTIDSDLQKVAQDALAETIQNIAAKGNYEGNQGADADAGAAVVIEVDTGEVLAAANYPTYSLDDLLNDYNSVLNAENQPLYNRAFQGTYPPGSTYKPLVALAALETGTITVNTKVTCTHIYTYYEDYQPKCLGTHGPISLEHALAVSCNFYFFEVGRLTTIQVIENYAKSFGFGEKTGIGLPESSGIVAGITYRSSIGEVWVPGDTLQAAIGQSDNLFTPLQLANYIATICSGGIRYQPRIVKQVVSKDGTETLVADEPVVAGTVELDPKNISSVMKGMLSVTLDGTGAGVFGDYPIKVGGKTGSAEVSSGSPNAVFVAFAPYDDPQIAVAIVIEHGWHGGEAANVAKAIFDAYFFPDGTEAAADVGELVR
ncbi:MAG TPA: penicillin-binding transpeptidase domain-containing protein [Oscillospiraceae bacterium]|nr:penicillin-binding transpeptidase domain-containing protein [Oscillospiraceae bacterium]HPF56625.1 penicillin-binding transpeptidase domain-containing protein [Clostridiales bacterium]HPK35378.1 penicillin-binding transpeptidase domain-containing protein [Oscillospiraceae bacterium]HPR76204.1 penicillin-binding transpeptidase domain-containing protein [Oscillospiraceae bacterium]